MCAWRPFYFRQICRLASLFAAISDFNLRIWALFHQSSLKNISRSFQNKKLSKYLLNFSDTCPVASMEYSSVKTLFLEVKGSWKWRYGTA